MMFTASAPSNIALLKYWGKRDAARQWPANDSLSMTLSTARTETSATIADRAVDGVVYAGNTLSETSKEAQKIARHLDRLRAATGRTGRLVVETRNTFPAGCGIASSASGFAALTVAGLAALLGTEDLAAHGFGLAEIAALARQGSGSACRSVTGGYVRWDAGDTPDTQTVQQIADADSFALADVIVVLSDREKAVSSTDAHTFAWSSPLFAPRLAGLGERLKRIEAALAAKDLSRLGPEIEAEALEMHAVIMTATPPVHYLTETTAAFCAWLRQRRAAGAFEAYFTIDAGPNVHVLTAPKDADLVALAARAAFGERIHAIIKDHTGSGPTLARGHERTVSP